MNEGDFLLTGAELALALLGFAGIVTALRRRSDASWTSGDSARFRSMVAGGVCALFFCLLPVPWLYQGVSELEWSAFNSILALVLLAYSAIGLHLLVWHERYPGIARGVALFVAVGNISCFAIVALGLFGVGFDRGVATYSVGVCWLVFFSAFFFVRIAYYTVVSDPRSAPDERAEDD